MSRTTSASTKAQKSQCFFEGVAGLGMTADHVRPLLGSERDAESSFTCAKSLPGRKSRMRSFRRLVARTFAQQLNPAIEQATFPFQFALTTKSGCECVAHIAQALRSRRKCLLSFWVIRLGIFKDVRSFDLPQCQQGRRRIAREGRTKENKENNTQKKTKKKRKKTTKKDIGGGTNKKSPCFL